MRVLAPALGRHICNSALQNFQKCLLHALTADVAGNRSVFRFAGDLIDLIDIDDTPLGRLYVKICRLQQPYQHVFHIVAHVTRLGQSGGVSDSKRNVQSFC